MMCNIEVKKVNNLRHKESHFVLKNKMANVPKDLWKM